jgi:hypothetical protein
MTAGYWAGHRAALTSYAVSNARTAFSCRADVARQRTVIL